MGWVTADMLDRLQALGGLLRQRIRADQWREHREQEQRPAPRQQVDPVVPTADLSITMGLSISVLLVCARGISSSRVVSTPARSSDS